MFAFKMGNPINKNDQRGQNDSRIACYGKLVGRLGTANSALTIREINWLKTSLCVYVWNSSAWVRLKTV